MALEIPAALLGQKWPHEVIPVLYLISKFTFHKAAFPLLGLKCSEKDCAVIWTDGCSTSCCGAYL